MNICILIEGGMCISTKNRTDVFPGVWVDLSSMTFIQKENNNNLKSSSALQLALHRIPSPP